jgi:hypothetical protein
MATPKVIIIITAILVSMLTQKDGELLMSRALENPNGVVDFINYRELLIRENIVNSILAAMTKLNEKPRWLAMNPVTYSWFASSFDSDFERIYALGAIFGYALYDLSWLFVCSVIPEKYVLITTTEFESGLAEIENGKNATGITAIKMGEMKCRG